MSNTLDLMLNYDSAESIYWHKDLRDRMRIVIAGNEGVGMASLVSAIIKYTHALGVELHYEEVY